MGILRICVVDWVDEKGIAGVEGSEIVEVTVDFLCRECSVDV